jgi:hypothetical protein
MLTMPRQFREDIPGMIERAGVAVERMQPDRVAFPEVTWERFVCRRGSAVAAVAIGLETGRDDRCIVAVSPDLRRALLFWRWLGDWRLVQDVAKSLSVAGAAAMDDTDA